MIDKSSPPPGRCSIPGVTAGPVGAGLGDEMKKKSVKKPAMPSTQILLRQILDELRVINDRLRDMMLDAAEDCEE